MALNDVDINFRAPALPQPPQDYDRVSFDQFNNVLRIYFNQLDEALRNAMAIQEPYDLQVSKGQVAGATPLYKFARNPDVDTTEETIWEQGGSYVWPTAASIMYVSSSNANDTNGGTGANKVKVFGLDANYLEIEEEVSLNGQTQVATTKSYLRVYRMYVLLAGSGGTAAGTVYLASSGASAGVPTGDVYANLGTSNQTQLGVYTVPAGRTLYLDDVNFTAAISQANATATVKFNIREFGSNVFRTIVISELQSNTLIDKFEYPLKIIEKTDIEVRAIATSSNNAITASWQGVLIDN